MKSNLGIGIILLLTVFGAIPTTAFPQELVINEVMSSNAATVFDEDGNTPDWIEIYNSGATPTSIGGYGLSDDESAPMKWLFPDITLQPAEHLLVLASGKDRSPVVLHWDTVINWGDEWKYLVPGSEPPSTWKTVGFADSEWASGPSGFGYGDGDDATVVSRSLSVFIRKVFDVAEIGDVAGAFLHIDYDDAFIAYLNGVEIARGNIGQAGDPAAYNRTADGGHEAELYQGARPEEFEIDGIGAILQEGANVLAIQVHNVGSGSSDLTAIPFLTLGRIHRPADAVGVPEILGLRPPALHTNFKIASDGETLLLSDDAGWILDIKETGQGLTDISIGRQPDGNDQWLFFLEPTPGSANTTEGYAYTLLRTPHFSHEGGFYDEGILLTLSTDSEGDTIYYSLDGTDPTAASEVFAGGIDVDSTAVVRARIINDGALPGKTITHTYLIGRQFTLPVVSISTTPANLWDDETGIYATGSNAGSEYPYFGANFWQDWETPAHIEFHEADGTPGFRLDAGISIFGGWSRGSAQKSFSIFARGQYGTGDIDYELFHDKDITEFEAFVLRNSGNDWLRSMFRDGMMTTLLGDLDIERQGFRPSTVYLNGEYWGILNVREKVNEHFIASNQNVDPTHIDLLESYGYAIHGDTVHYDAMRDFFLGNDLSVGENYAYIKTQMDIGNFIRYTLSMIYFDNRDWPGNNIKFWRPRTPVGKWRWIVYDTDFGFNRYSGTNHMFNTLEFALEPNGPGWPNPPWSTLLLRELMENDEFKRDFVNSFADHLNTTFKADRVLETIDHYRDMLLTEMPLHLDRWDGSMAVWTNDVLAMRAFGSERVAYVREHIRERFGFSDTYEVDLDVSDSSQGKVRINTIEVKAFPWRGTYFQENPIQITAVPRTGYRFSGWTGIDSESQNLTVDPTGDISIVAHFEEDEDYTSPIIINEINYHSGIDFDTEDWVELHNRSNIVMDISGWVLRDSDDAHEFIVPDHTAIPGGGYAILSRDERSFSVVFPEVEGVTGDLGFGLASTGDEIRLFDESGNLMDSVLYSNLSPWAEAADGDGPTLELISPDRDNSLPESWTVATAGGTPGLENNVGDGPLAGDIDGNWVIGLSDAVLALKIVSSIAYEAQVQRDADVNGDGRLGVVEAVYALRAVAGMAQ